MRLTKLTLSGFKSFADETAFEFSHPITGIVGPNGCGKSNVVDAIKWVLGERSSKSLRGTEMTDVIFAGSAGRKPLGTASVKLTFDNPILESPPESAEQALESADQGDNAARETDDAQRTKGQTPQARGKRGLGYDADVVEIERRLYRDGGSEYLINNKQARLKDIREMFMDTGVGADAYSIIEQGKVDAMLLASPQERRTIFEEAAGIAKYKQRRIEASRRMDRADANLKISKEQLESTERRLRLVKGQAAKARKYQELTSELRAWRLALAFEQYDELVSRIEGLTSQQQAAGHARDAAHTHLQEVESQRDSIDGERALAAAAVEAAERARLSADHTRQQATQRRNMLQRSIDDAGRELASLTASLQRITEASQTGEVSLADSREQIAALSEKLHDAERTLSTHSAARSAAASELDDKRRTAQEKFSAASRIDRERVQLTATVQSETRRAANVRENLQSLAQRRARFDTDKAAAAAQLATMRETAGTAKTAAATHEEQLATLESSLTTLSSDRRSQAQRMSELDQERVRIESRLHALQELVESRAGYAESVRELLRRKDSHEAQQKKLLAKNASHIVETNPFASIRGALADLIRMSPQIDAQLAGLVELALGPDLDALVVASIDDVPAAEKLLGLPGRVVFLPTATQTLHESGDEADNATSGASHTMAGHAHDSAALHAGSHTEVLLGLLHHANLLANEEHPSGVVPLRGLVQPRMLASHAEKQPALTGASTQLASDNATQEPSEAAAQEALQAAQISTLLDRVLGTTLLVQDLATAQLLAAGPLAPSVLGFDVRFVTAAGEVVDSVGRVIAGPASKGEVSPGLLRRQNEVQALQASLSEVSASATKQREQLQAADAESASLSAQIADARSKLSQQQRAAQSASSNVERLELDLARFDRELASLGQDQSRLEQTLATIEGEIAKSQQKIESLSRLHEEQITAAREADGLLHELARNAEGLSELVSTARVLVGTLTQEQASAKRELARLEQQREEHLRRMREDGARIEQLQLREQEQKQAVLVAETELVTAAAAIAASQEQLAVAATVLEEVSTKVSELASGVQTARQRASSIDRDFHSLEVSRRELEVKREGLEERTMTDLAVDLRDELMLYRAVLAPHEQIVANARVLAEGEDAPAHNGADWTSEVVEVVSQLVIDTSPAMSSEVAAMLSDGEDDALATAELPASAAEEKNVQTTGTTQTISQRWLITTQPVVACAKAVDSAEASKAVEELRSAVTKLGNVNMEALEEEQTLEGQNQELVRQVADLEAAREQLSALIEQLNLASRERFGDVFGKIQQQFGGEHGMYRKLFGGGRAEVRLMPLVKEVEQADGSIVKVETEETDLLESGIEVIAKPPGKEPRSISQLSGGEKTLTAVALLMSIFRSKPSCFCVLDEVDAALDEGNVGRFNSCVRDFTDLSRFIIITHNKRTMQNADHLYGVTQQEKGVSTRVSVKFDQVGKDGRVDVSVRQPTAIALPRTTSERDEPEVVVTPAVTKPKRARKPAAAAANTDVTGERATTGVGHSSSEVQPTQGVAASLAKLRELT